MRYTTTMNQEMKRRVTACAAGFSLPRYRELPSVGLYLDQTVQLVNSCFRGFPGVVGLSFQSVRTEEIGRAHV